ncbi:DUF1697 domain-containing protein [Mycolicibacter hiberniae]|uniref:Pyridoxamine 5'-phosphate oxidase n=1 Tax=Mycolicibacter hiberniae TaxID=29314 RepID=A0A7I7X0A1_9MYCO|nr:DUF1697 domain-containing protein [Mycolicibacter hiberniae]MCV7086658.1 DUF1697 domain-containing protein [Mycolicibacter hiberniae]ORV67006.1 pyridoxamine 5-phosphate oxidase [Mycolicibacter hiberniae]BBZ22243.1 pyridoxamine 5'-phosphate oxidase [Mycolicibacter hiberniae]
MSRYALFLRGVNVGGIKLKMPDVAAALRDAGFDEVRTLLASGNVLLDSPAKAAAVRATAESALRQRFDYQAWVLVYDVDTVREIVAAYPFDAVDPGLQSYVTFVADDAVLAELAELTDGDEKITLGDGVVYWQVPKGDTLTSPVGKTMGAKRYQSATTTRNLRTVHKVLDSADR